MTGKMKPSGVAWIGDIPEGWEMSRVKYHYEISLGKMLQPLPLALTDTLEYYMCSANITWNGISLTPLKQMWFNASEKAQYKLRKGDLLVTEGGDVAVSCIWNGEVEDCYLQNAAHRVRQIGAAGNRFLYYWLFLCKHTGYIDQICNKATIAHFTKEKFGEIPLCVMRISEQKAIADFLDVQCAKIDSVIADIEKQIETLQKYKKSLITEVVTKGLDRSGPMKDSEIDWIGDIAKNYCVRRLKYLTVIKDGTHDTPDYVDESEDSYPLITSKYINYETKDINFEEAKHISKSDFEKIYKRSDVEYGDIIMPMIGTIGNPVIVQTHRKFAIKNVALFKTSVDLITAKYIFYQFYSDILSEQFSIMSRGGVQSFVSLEVLGNLLFIDCTHEEKQQIVEYLDAKCSHIDEVINQKKQQLSVILHHKKSLIYEYVTGKKRVTEVN